MSFGWNKGSVYVEAKASTHDNRYSLSFIGGLGGADITVKMLAKCIGCLQKKDTKNESVIWLTSDFVEEV